MRRSANVFFGLWIAITASACQSTQPATVAAPIATAGSSAGRGGAGGATSSLAPGVGGTTGTLAGGGGSSALPSTTQPMGLDLFATPVCTAIQAEAPGMPLGGGAAGQAGGAGMGAAAGAGSTAGAGASSSAAAGAAGSRSSAGTGGAHALILAGAGGASGSAATAGTGGLSGAVSASAGSAAGAAGASAAAAGSAASGGVAGATATFDDVYQLLVCEGCNNSYCHGTVAGFSVSDSRSELYTTLLGPDGQGAPTGDAVSLGKCGGMKRVVPGDPDHSLLYLKVSQHQPCGDAMPPPGQDRMLSGFFNAREVGVVRSWIAGGAKK